MSFAVIGLSHRTAPVEVRERFTFSSKEVPAALVDALRDDAVREVVLLSTCNRTELYLLLSDPEHSLLGAADLLIEHAGPLPQAPETYLYTRRGADVVRHLYRVTAGLDSMVLGEVQIQGQVREGYEIARGLSGERQAVRSIFNRLFQSALSVGGRVRTDTRLSEGAASIPSVGVELAKKIFGSLSGKRGMVLGAGEMSELTARTLVDEGLSAPIVASRSYEKAQVLAESIGGEAIPYSELWNRLEGVDILITSTSAPHPVITAEEFRRAMPRLRKSLLIVDISVPRDVEPEVGQLRNVFLYSIDDLEQIVKANHERRRDEIPKAEEIIAEAVDEFWRWRAGLKAVPIIKELRGRAELVRRAEFEKAISRFGNITPEDRERIERLTRSMLQKLLHEPTARLRKAAENGSDLDLLAAIRYLLGPKDDGEEGED